MSSTAEAAERTQALFAEAALRFLGERSTELAAVVIDVLKKDTLGNYAAATVLPKLVADLNARTTPEDVGQRLRRLGVRLGLGPTAFVWTYQFGRLQHYVDQGWPQADVDLGDQEAASQVLDFWARMMASYRNDGSLVPGQDGGAHSFAFLDDATVADLAARALTRGAPVDGLKLRRALAKIELYIFVIHAEAREGIFHHGPYPLPDGRVLVVKELTDLQNRFMPWMTPERKLDVSQVIMPMVFESVECRFDMFGTLYTQPTDYFPHLVGFDLLAGEELRPMQESDLLDLADLAQSKQKDLFRELASWDDRYRIMHAAPQFANTIATILEAAGYRDDEIEALVMRPFEEVGEQVIDDVLTGRGADMWDYVGTGHEPLFPPVSA